MSGNGTQLVFPFCFKWRTLKRARSDDHNGRPSSSAGPLEQIKLRSVTAAPLPPLLRPASAELDAPPLPPPAPRRAQSFDKSSQLLHSSRGSASHSGLRPPRPPDVWRAEDDAAESPSAAAGTSGQRNSVAEAVGALSASLSSAPSADSSATAEFLSNLLAALRSSWQQGALLVDLAAASASAPDVREEARSLQHWPLRSGPTRWLTSGAGGAAPAGSRPCQECPPAARPLPPSTSPAQRACHITCAKPPRASGGGCTGPGAGPSLAAARCAHRRVLRRAHDRAQRPGACPSQALGAVRPRPSPCCTVRDGLNAMASA